MTLVHFPSIGQPVTIGVCVGRICPVPVFSVIVQTIPIKVIASAKWKSYQSTSVPFPEQKGAGFGVNKSAFPAVGQRIVIAVTIIRRRISPFKQQDAVCVAVYKTCFVG